jgi:hypothetical protein
VSWVEGFNNARASCTSGPWVKRPWQELSSECFSWAWALWLTAAATSLRSIPNFLVLLVNDSEYSRSAGAKPILSISCIYLVSPAALRAPTSPRPLVWGREVPKKKKPPASALALEYVCVGVGEVGVAFGASWPRCVKVYSCVS